MNLSVFVKRHWYPLAAGALIALGVASRLALILVGWPHSNSEEGTMGLEAMHILLRGERPIYLYGQNYMGVGEAYMGAVAFHLFGVTTVALRLGMVLCYALLLLGVFWLAHQLYPRRVALTALGALILGTPFIVKIELLADGGKAETLALSALMCALTTWLALNRPSGPASRRQRALRYAAFFAWGAMAGFGLYTYTIIAPFVLTTGLLLALTCHRELAGWALALPLAGLLFGLTPDILYTATSPLDNNPIAVFWSLHQTLNPGGATGLKLLTRQIEATLLYTLPTTTGLLTFYPVEAMPLYGPLRPQTLAAVFIGGGWSVCYLALLALATWRPLLALRRHWEPRWQALTARGAARERLRKRQMEQRERLEQAQQARTSPITTPAPGRARRDAQHLAQLLLALAGWLTIIAYTLSATAANNPHSGRYMIALLVVTPALLWPLLEPVPAIQMGGGLWSALRTATRRRQGAALARAAWRPLVIALFVVGLVVGVVGMGQSLPGDVAADGRDVVFEQALLSHGVTRFYSDYWTCDLMNFETREAVICSVIEDYGHAGYTRYHPYTLAVQADPSAPYVLVRGSEVERTFLIHAAQVGQRYSESSLDGRDVYTPVAP